jgi:hypothetical protein
MHVEIGTLVKHFSFSGNICFEFSILFLCSVGDTVYIVQVQASIKPKQAPSNFFAAITSFNNMRNITLSQR